MKQTERPPDSDFQQQNLNAWQPLLTPQWVIGTFLVIGIVFVPIGAAVLHASLSVVEVSKEYHNEPCYPPIVDGSCWTSVSLYIPKTMKPPIYFYYKLTNFYQNHRRFVKSRSEKQLSGSADFKQTDCEPLVKAPSGKVLYPCGLIANSYFNDTFASPKLCPTNDSLDDACTSLRDSWTDKEIAWKSDRESKYKLPDDFNSSDWNSKYTRVGTGNFTLPLPTQEDFMVWMRTAGLPTFKKLRYKILDKELPAGSYFAVDIFDTFPVRDFSGTKSVVLSTTSWLGGKNDFLGWAYIVVGVLCLVLALGFCLKQKFDPRPLGDMRYYNIRGTSRT